MTSPRIAVIIPCFRVKEAVLDVIARIGPEVDAIFVVDDACPEQVGDFVKRSVSDPRVRVIRHSVNGGVGAASLTGMTAAAAEKADILVKLDGDGQMDPALLARLVAPLLRGEADYAKGNRFFAPEMLIGMPPWRIFGNGILSLLTKLSSGYWNIFDPTNGYVAIHTSIFLLLPQSKIAKRFFFESDLLFRLNLMRARVKDVPMHSIYRSETSSLRITRVVLPFIGAHLRNLIKRIGYSYFIRDFSLGSIYLILGVPLVLFGLVFGFYEWIWHARANVVASAGTVMLASLPLIIGSQLLLSFLGFDISNVPQTPIHTHRHQITED